jgi:hypothetical protein
LIFNEFLNLFWLKRFLAHLLQTVKVLKTKTNLKGGKVMKKLVMVTVLVLGLGLAGIASAGYWGNMMGPGWGHGGYGYMMGPGFRGQGGPGYGGTCWGNTGGYGTQGQRILTKQDAEAILGNYIGGNPNLKAGKVEDKTNYFEAEIRTKDNSLVSRLAIDKNTGWVRQIN